MTLCCSVFRSAARSENSFGMVHVSSDFLDRLSYAEKRDQERLSEPATPQLPKKKRRSPVPSQVRKGLKKLAAGGRTMSPKKAAAAKTAKEAAEKAVQEQRRRETKPSASDPAREVAQHGYEVLGPIASGAFSTILRARAVGPPTGGNVAVKTFDRAKCDKAKDIGDQTRSELYVLRLLASEAKAYPGRHGHIAYMLAEHTGPNSIHAVLEYCQGGSLLRHMQLLQRTKAPARGATAHSAAGSASEGVGMPEAQAAALVWQLTSALAHLHSLDVAHRDIKPGNILFDNEGGANAAEFRIKLCDFGFAIKCGGRRLKKLVGTPSYIAPELTGCGTEGGYKGKPVDMWALGVLLFEILHGKPTFYGANLEQLETRIRAVSHAPFDPQIAPGARTLVSSLLKADPGKRLSSKATLNHAWLKAHDRGDARVALEASAGLIARQSTPDVERMEATPSELASIREQAEDQHEQDNVNEVP